MISNEASNLTTEGSKKRIVISLTACIAATAAPTPNSAPTRLIPSVPPGAAPKRAITGSTPRSLLLIKPTINPVNTRLIVINKAGFQSDCN